MDDRRFDICECGKPKLLNDNMCYDCRSKIENCTHCGKLKAGQFVSQLCDECVSKIMECHSCNYYFWEEENNGKCPICQSATYELRHISITSILAKLLNKLADINKQYICCLCRKEKGGLGFSPVIGQYNTKTLKIKDVKRIINLLRKEEHE